MGAHFMYVSSKSTRLLLSGIKILAALIRLSGTLMAAYTQFSEDLRRLGIFDSVAIFCGIFIQVIEHLKSGITFIEIEI